MSPRWSLTTKVLPSRMLTLCLRMLGPQGAYAAAQRLLSFDVLKVASGGADSRDRVQHRVEVKGFCDVRGGMQGFEGVGGMVVGADQDGRDRRQVGSRELAGAKGVAVHAR